MPTSNIFLHKPSGEPIPALGNADGSLAIADYPYQTAVDAVDANTTYVGEAEAGSETSASVWRIKKILTSGAITTVKYADSSTEFSKKWDDRATYSY